MYDTFSGCKAAHQVGLAIKQVLLHRSKGIDLFERCIFSASKLAIRMLFKVMSF